MNGLRAISGATAANATPIPLTGKAEVVELTLEIVDSRVPLFSLKFRSAGSMHPNMATATASPVPPVKKKRRSPSRKAKPGLSFPMARAGQAALIGLGNWETYLIVDRALGSRAFRIRYHRGKIDLMSISSLHEYLKSCIGIFVEAFCDVKGVDYIPWGSTTQRVEGVMGGEPDGSYNFGAGRKERPELVIEIGLTSGGIEKLAFWAELPVSEVWIWQNDQLHAVAFTEGRYEPVTESRCLPGFPFAVVRELIRMEPASQAVREFRRRLQAE